MARTSYRWAGHVARMGKYEPDRLVYQALTYKDRSYLRTLEEMYGQQCHGRNFRKWRWERQFYKILGDDWLKQAWDNTAWEDNFEEWYEWR
eukprot:3929526-Karenia_brevis.AAC.1